MDILKSVQKNTEKFCRARWQIKRDKKWRRVKVVVTTCCAKRNRNPHWARQPSPWKLKADSSYHSCTHSTSGPVVGGCHDNRLLENPRGTQALTRLSLLPLTSTSKMICPSSWGLWGRGGLWAQTTHPLINSSQLHIILKRFSCELVGFIAGMENICFWLTGRCKQEVGTMPSCFFGRTNAHTFTFLLFKSFSKDIKKNLMEV